MIRNHSGVGAGRRSDGCPTKTARGRRFFSTTLQRNDADVDDLHLIDRPVDPPGHRVTRHE